MKAEDQDFSAEFTLSSSALEPTECHAVVLWFDTDFSARHCVEAPIRLSTSPHQTPTHWAQTVLILKEPVLLLPPLACLTEGSSATDQLPAASQSTSSGGAAAASLTGRLSMARNKVKHRMLDISLEYSAQLNNGRTIKHTTIYTMGVAAGSD
jgi:protein arginine N-methyltransferase 3